MLFSWECQEKEDQKTIRQVLIGAGFSSRILKRIRRQGSISINNLPQRLIDRVKAGDLIVVKIDEPQDNQMIKHDPEIDLIYLDDWYLAVNKRAGQVVHPTMGHGSETVIAKLSDKALHPVVRLDKETSGVFLIARFPLAHYFASSNPMKKIYLAVVHGRFENEQGFLKGPIKRSSEDFIRRVVDPDGKAALTAYQEISFSPDNSSSLVAFRLMTGRTHQIRLHALWHGHPLLGDGLYGLEALKDYEQVKDFVRADLWPEARKLLQDPERLEKDQLIARQALHAAYLSFRHVKSRAEEEIFAPLPQDMAILCQKLAISLRGKDLIPKSLLELKIDDR